MTKTGTGFRAIAALAAAACLTLTLGGCGRAGEEAPSAARARVAAGAPAGFGTVDCRPASVANGGAPLWGSIALTFDAGPSQNSARLLDILKQKKVPATFFLLLQRPNDAIEHLIGRRPTLMRPPQGRTNDTVRKVCKELGMSEVLWSVTAKDYLTNDSALITRRVLDQASRDGIILLHDIYPGTVPAVPGIVDALKKRGYVFVTVPQLLAPAKPEPGKVYRP